MVNAILARTRRTLPDLVRVWLIVGGLSLAVAALSWHPSVRYLMLPVAVLIVWVVAAHPQPSMVALVVAAMMAPFAIGTGTQTALNVGVLGVMFFTGLWVLQMLYNRKIELVPSRTTLALVALVFVAGLSFLFSYLPWNAFAQLAPLKAQLGGLSIFVLSACAFLLAANLLRSRMWLERLVWVFVSINLVYLLGRLYGPLAWLTLGWAPGANGSAFWIWMAALPVGQALFNTELSRGRRLLLMGAGVLTLAVAMIKQLDWASGWLPPLIAVGIIVMFRWPRRTLLLAPIVATVFYVALAAIRSVVTSDFSWEARLAAWQIVLQIARLNPLLGLGPSNYYYYTPLYNILGYYIRFNSHNNYVDLIAQTGLLGTAAFFWFAAEFWREGWGLRHRVKTGFSQGYVAACMAGLVAMLITGMIGDWFLPFVYNVGIAGFRASILFWVFLGGMISLKRTDVQEA